MSLPKVGIMLHKCVSKICREPGLVVLLCLFFGQAACRATYQSVKATSPRSEVDPLTVPITDPNTKPVTDPGTTLTPKPTKDPFTILERTRTLSVDESQTRGCRGIITIYEKGPDINRDNVLQPNEINETRSECQPGTTNCDPTGKSQTQPRCTDTQNQTQSQRR